eukprot:6542306-Alexandrium_andersonii.AAC.1
MGGAPSPLLWAMAYDPIIVGVAQGTGSADPTFVDDMSAEVEGPAQTMAVARLLLATSHVAGLHVETHTCQDVR